MKKTALLLILLACVLIVSGCGPSRKKYTLSERRAIIDGMAQNTLQRLYREEAAAKQQVIDSAGYGVFSNANVNVIFVSGGTGYGVVVDMAGNKTYMKMGLGGLGLGIGAKDYRQVLIFRDSNTLQSFIDKGWEFGGHADAAAKAGEQGGEVSGEGDINDDIIVYSMTEAGLSLQATVTGSKYWKDDELN